MSKRIDLTGNKYNLLTVVGYSHTENGNAVWRCKCECGNETLVRGSNLKSNAVKSCGCLLHKEHDTHHLSQTRLYKIYASMKSRCYDTKIPYYDNYGGRGITVCEEWRKDFLEFYKWANENGYQDGLTIDRIDNNKGYAPDNCRWATKKEQARNRRNCVLITYNGKTQTLVEWCEELNLKYKRVHDRMYAKGWSFERAISTPVYEEKKNLKYRKGD